MKITQLLLAAQSADARIRTEAEGSLRQFQEQNLPQFLQSLSFELANNDKPSASRQLAGILLKSSLDANDSARKDHLVKQWFAIDVALRSKIKELLLRTLGSSALEARHASAQVIAKVACIEIPQKQWPELVGSLLNNMTQQGSPAHLKQSTLETLGYVCEEISHHDLVQDEVNSLLTAVVQGMNQSKNTAEVRLAATKALLNEMERNYIMKTVCECSKEAEIRQAAFECLVSIASSTYYVRDTTASKDEKNRVRDRIAQTLSRIFEFLHSPNSGFSVISPENPPSVVALSLESIKDVPNVAEKVCGAVNSLAQGCEDYGTSSSLLSPCLTEIITHLLRGAAYETLPYEITEEILLRTPPESLIRFKSCSKRLYNLIGDNRFIYRHIEHSPEKFLRIDNEQRVEIMDPATGVHCDTPFPDEFRIGYPGSFVRMMVHCDGLMLCRFMEDIAVWNPVLGKIKWIELYCRGLQQIFGIGYDNANRSTYKVLRFYDVHYPSDHVIVETDPRFRAEIYDLNSSSWRTIVAHHDKEVDWLSEGVCVEGNMYWIVVRDKRFDILSFDFSMESFTLKCVCPPLSDTRQLGCYERDRLSLLTYHEKSAEIQVWLTSSLCDGVVQFTKYFGVTTALRFPYGMANPGYSVRKNKAIMLLCEEVVEEEGEWYTCINLYEIGEDGVRKKTETGRHANEEYYSPFTSAYVYVPTLIPLPN